MGLAISCGVASLFIGFFSFFAIVLEKGNASDNFILWLVFSTIGLLLVPLGYFQRTTLILTEDSVIQESRRFKKITQKKIAYDDIDIVDMDLGLSILSKSGVKIKIPFNIKLRTGIPSPQNEGDDGYIQFVKEFELRKSQS